MRLLATLIAVLALTGPACADWQLQCDPDKCRAFTYTDTEVALRHMRILVEFADRVQLAGGVQFADRLRFSVSALMTREQYKREFGSSPPTDETFGTQQYVRMPNFFSGRLRARVRVDGHLIATARPDPTGLVVLYPTDAFLNAVKHGHALQVHYAVESDGYSPPLSFDVSGLEGALSKFRLPFFAGQLPACPDALRRKYEQREKETGLATFISCRPDPTPPFSEANEVGTVALLLDAANRRGIQSTDLSAVRNPYGLGAWAYVKGRKGFIWFINDGNVVAVTVLAKGVTPDALDPYDAGAFGNHPGFDTDGAVRAGATAIPPP